MLRNQDARTRALNTILDGIAASRRHLGLSSDYQDLGWLLHMSWKVDLSEAREVAKAWAAVRQAKRTFSSANAQRRSFRHTLEHGCSQLRRAGMPRKKGAATHRDDAPDHHASG